jgi:hypothetical protein
VQPCLYPGELSLQMANGGHPVVIRHPQCREQILYARGAPSQAKGANRIIGYCLPDGMGAGLELAQHRRRTCKETPCCVVSSVPVPPLRTACSLVAAEHVSCVCRLARRHV